MGPGRWTVAGSLVAVLALLTGCGEVEPETAGLDLPEGAALIPPDALAGHELRTLELEPKPILSGLGRSDKTLVVEAEGAVVAIVESPAELFAERRGAPLEEEGVPGPTIGEGQPTRLVEGYGLMRRSLLFTRGASIVEIASRTLSVEALAEVAAEVTTPIDGDGAVPGELIGVLRPEPDRPVAVASYPTGEEGSRYPMAIFAAPASVQAAYLAVAHLDPRESIDPMTEASCCANDIMRPARAVAVRGVESTIATLTNSSKVLVVPGDPGIVVVTTGVRSWDDTIPTDDQMIALAEESTIGSQEDLVAGVRARDDAILEAQLSEIRASEEANGWTVLLDLIHDEHPMVISTGGAARPYQGFDEPEGPKLCAVYLSEQVSTGSPIAACVSTVAPSDPLVIASAVEGGMPLQAGAVRGDVARVALEYPQRSFDALIVDIPPTAGVAVDRMFLLVARVHDQIDSAGEDLTAAMRQAAFVAYDAGGAELSRIPQFPHLQG